MVTPRRMRYGASVLTMFTTPARAAPEWTNMGAPRSNEKVWTTLTIEPDPASAIGPMNRLVMFHVPCRFRSTTERQPLSLMVLGNAGNCPPALFTRLSTRPNRSYTCARNASTWSGSRMLVGTATQVPPASALEAATSSSLDGVRPAITT